MPDPLLYLRAAALAALVGTAWGLFQRLARRRWRDGNHFASALIASGWALAVFAGLAVLSVRPAIPPRNGLDRLFVLVLPATLLIEAIGPWLPRLGVHALRFGAAMPIPAVLLYRSVYLAGGADAWNWTTTVIVLASLGLSLAVVWELLARLSERTSPTLVGFSLAMTIQATGMMIMLAGYLRGGAVSFPLAAALASIVLVSPHSTDDPPARGTIGFGVVTLYGLLMIGRFFGNLSTAMSLAALCVPLGGWLVVPWAWRQRHPRITAAIYLGFVAVALAVLLGLAKAQFDRKMGPLLRVSDRSPPATRVSDQPR